MASSKGHPVKESSFRYMIREIVQERGRMVRNDPTAEGGFCLVPMEVNCFWTRLFCQHFLDTHDEYRDDMLFFVYRRTATNRAEMQQMERARLEVYRKDSKNLPSLGDPGIDWEETVYLNLILQQYEYILTCAVCTKTRDKMAIHKKDSVPVYASPSRRRMDKKGVESEVSYPNLFFFIDNFDEVFGDVTVQEGQMLCVELVACEKQGPFRSVVFLGSVRYEALKTVYETRASTPAKLVSRMSMGWFKAPGSSSRIHSMKGPEGKGYAEVAVSRNTVDDNDNWAYPQSGGSTPASPAHSRANRAMSNSLPWGQKWGGMRKSHSDSETLSSMYEDDNYPQNEDEIPLSESWKMKLMRPYSTLTKMKKTRSTNLSESYTLNVQLTYVTLPWHRIIADICAQGGKLKIPDVLEIQKRPVLTTS
ncbi:LOW QUALITY PROTEIN: uncharacterized protein KIAA0930 homolog [Amphiura filiformis]|uniref:LOW QUALITY PROTEIN: uncharacterized protein KIAA0930 homolog n=1 Tax=Amphiura filiformis TaxID=82378 RepID=UPI003B217132